MPVRLRRSRVKQERGQALVEFAIVAQILVVLLLAIFQFGIVWSNYVAVTDASREAARRAAVNRQFGSSQVVSAATSAARTAASDLDQDLLQVTTTALNGTFNQGDPIKVCVTYPYSISIVGWAVSNGHLNSCTTMRLE